MAKPRTLFGCKVEDLPASERKFGPVVLLLPCLWAGPRHFENLGTALNTLGFDAAVITFPEQGPGGNLKKLGKLSVQEMAAAVYLLISGGFDGRPVILVGHSMGALVARLVLKHPLAKAAVCMASSPSRGFSILNLKLLWNMLPYLLKMLRRKPVNLKLLDIRDVFFNGDMAQATEMNMTSVPASGRACLQCAMGTVRVPNVQKPVLFVAGASDLVCGLSSQKAMAEFHRGQCVVLPGAHHMFPAIREFAWQIAGHMRGWVLSHRL